LTALAFDEGSKGFSGLVKKFDFFQWILPALRKAGNLRIQIWGGKDRGKIPETRRGSTDNFGTGQDKYTPVNPLTTCRLAKLLHPFGEGP
jgi:hypothetical protein